MIRGPLTQGRVSFLPCVFAAREIAKDSSLKCFADFMGSIGFEAEK